MFGTLIFGRCAGASAPAKDNREIRKSIHRLVRFQVPPERPAGIRKAKRLISARDGEVGGRHASIDVEVMRLVAEPHAERRICDHALTGGL